MRTRCQVYERGVRSANKKTESDSQKVLSTESLFMRDYIFSLEKVVCSVGSWRMSFAAHFFGDVSFVLSTRLHSESKLVKG